MLTLIGPVDTLGGPSQGSGCRVIHVMFKLIFFKVRSSSKFSNQRSVQKSSFGSWPFTLAECRKYLIPQGIKLFAASSAVDILE